MASKVRLLGKVRDVLVDRFFTEPQIENIIPRLHEEILKEPKYLGEIIDTWNMIMNSSGIQGGESSEKSIPSLAKPPRKSLTASLKVDMTTILGDVEPDLLLLDPKKLITRHTKLSGLGITNNLGEQWTMLYNAPRGLYLQDWVELTKKIYYIEHRVLDFLYCKKELKAMTVHPLVKSAAATEADFDHIRTRYLFALRCGYKSLSHLYSVQMALNTPTLTDIILADDQSYLEKFTPFCSLEEYSCFANLIKNHDIDLDDANVFQKLADLHSLSHESCKQSGKKQIEISAVEFG